MEVEKVKGWFTLKNTLISSFFLVVIAIIGVYFANNKMEPSEQNTVNVKEAKNSPVAAKVETQNIYYLDTPKKDIPPPPIVVVKQREPAKSKSNETTINADNALIVTSNQSGGSNTVVQQIPEPVLKEINHEKKTKSWMK